MFYSQDILKIRGQFFLSWQKYVQRQPLDALEQQIIKVIEYHTEYHPLFNTKTIEEFLNKAEQQSSLFLHLGLHLTIRDQIELDRPKGIAGIYQGLMLKYANSHDVEHLLMDRLQMYLQDSLHGSQSDENQYLEMCKRIR